MKTFVQPGVTLTLAAPYAVSAGGGLKVGAIIGIAHADAANGANVEALTQGVVVAASDTGTAWAVGDTIYWDNTAKNFTKTTTSNTKAGVCVVAKASGDTTATIKLIPTI